VPIGCFLRGWGLAFALTAAPRHIIIDIVRLVYLRLLFIVQVFSLLILQFYNSITHL
jgi:hypothetical protein